MVLMGWSSCCCQRLPAPGLWTRSGPGPPAEWPLQPAPRPSFRDPGSGDWTLCWWSSGCGLAETTTQTNPSWLLDSFTGSEAASSQALGPAGSRFSPQSIRGAAASAFMAPLTHLTSLQPSPRPLAALSLGAVNRLQIGFQLSF